MMTPGRTAPRSHFSPTIATHHVPNIMILPAISDIHYA